VVQIKLCRDKKHGSLPQTEVTHTLYWYAL